MPDRLTWAEIRRLALRHRKGLILANLIAVLATLCSVPIPLLLPLLVDEVLLKQGSVVVQRGTNHAWANRSERPCRMLFVLVDGSFEPSIAEALAKR